MYEGYAFDTLAENESREGNHGDVYFDHLFSGQEEEDAATGGGGEGGGEGREERE